jgi:hypothetical protein
MKDIFLPKDPLGGLRRNLRASKEQAVNDGARSAEEESPSAVTVPDVVAESMSSGLPRVLEITAAIIAPTTLLTALMFYFGWSHAYWFCYYFGVNSTMLDFTIQDYLMRSVDGFFVPLTMVTVIMLPILWNHWFLKSRLAVKSNQRVPLNLAVGAVTFGLSLLFVGVANVLGWKILNYAYIPALSLVVGVLLLGYGVRLYRRIRSSDEDLAARRSTSASMAVAGGLFTSRKEVESDDGL